MGFWASSTEDSPPDLSIRFLYREPHCPMRNSLFHGEIPPKIPAIVFVMDANVDASGIVYRHQVAALPLDGFHSGFHGIDGYATPVTSTVTPPGRQNPSRRVTLVTTRTPARFAVRGKVRTKTAYFSPWRPDGTTPHLTGSRMRRYLAALIAKACRPEQSAIGARDTQS